MIWKTKTLAELCKMYQPKTLSKKQLKSDGKYFVYGANGIIGKYNKYNHEKSQLLITCRGATCGSINTSKPFSWINGNAMVIQPNQNEISKEFLKYLFMGPIDFSKIITGAAQPQITRESLNFILVSYPSLQEQQRLVAKLDAAFAEIDKVTDLTKERIIKEKDIKISILKSIFSNIKIQKTISEIATVISGQSPEGRYYNKNAVGTPFYQGKKEFGDYELKKPSVWTTKITKVALKGDVLLSVRAPVGEANMNYDKICIGRGLAAIRANKENNSEFIYYFLNSIKDQIVGNTGAVFNSINKKQIENITIPTPSIDEQNQITDKIKQILSHVKKINLLTKQKIHNLNILKLSLLNKELINKTA